MIFKHSLSAALLTGLLLSGCSNESDPIVNSKTTDAQPENAVWRTQDEILTIAQSISNKTKSRNGNKTIDKTSIKKLSRRSGRSENNIPPIYAIDYNDGQGYMLISGNRETATAATPLLTKGRIQTMPPHRTRC